VAAYLAQLLTDPYSATRQVAYRSIRGLPGFETLVYDYVAPRGELERSATLATETWLALAESREASPHLLMEEGGVPDVEEWLRLLEQRDHRPVTIVE
jgi:hypothetical protein